MANKKETTPNYGLVIAPKDPNAFVLGAANELPKIELVPSGQWDEYLPIYEPQAEFYETCGCTVWGTQNLIEMYLKRLVGTEFNYSERFNYILANITCPGADPHYVCESIRANNVINQDRLPVPQTLEEFLAPMPMTPELLLEGLRWPYVFWHEWVMQGYMPMEEQKAKMMDTLRYSPLAVALYAWERQDGLYIRPPGAQDVHWCVIYGYEESKFWKCFDSYNHSIKHLHWDFGFSYVKRLHITAKAPVKKSLNWLENLFTRLASFFRNIFRPNFVTEK